MSSTLFRIVEHTSPCQHIREYPNGLKRGKAPTMQIAVKQYIPLNDLEPDEHAITIIAAHALGFPKVERPMYTILVEHSCRVSTL